MPPQIRLAADLIRVPNRPSSVSYALCPRLSWVGQLALCFTMTTLLVKAVFDGVPQIISKQDGSHHTML